jgi:hypothetical protein
LTRVESFCEYLRLWLGMVSKPPDLNLYNTFLHGFSTYFIVKNKRFLACFLEYR